MHFNRVVEPVARRNRLTSFKHDPWRDTLPTLLDTIESCRDFFLIINFTDSEYTYIRL